MSRWTHLAGALIVETFEEIPVESANAYFTNKLEKAPKITGSERDADLFLNVVPGYNSCTWNEDGAKVTFQSKIIITLAGSLRDKDQGKTLEELTEFANYIANDLGWMIEENAFTIDDEGLEDTININLIDLIKEVKDED